MKANKGQAIVCNCREPAGSFRRNIDDRAISSNDFAISFPGAPDDEGQWICPTCQGPVARRFSGDEWQVRTKVGWVK